LTLEKPILFKESRFLSLIALEISKGRIFFGNGDELVVRMVELESRTSSDFLTNGESCNTSTN